MIFKMNKSRLSRKIAATLMMWAAFPIGAFAAESNETNEDATEYANMEDMLITAERIPTNKWDTPANIAIITAKDIEDNRYQSVTEALENVNGVYVPHNDLANNVMMNGTNRVILLVDGRRLNSPQQYRTSVFQDGAETRGDVSPVPSMKMIERIEIIKGGNSALYGSDAVGGVVNIITKKGRRNETTVDINKAFGQSHRFGTEITNQGISGNFGYFFAGSFRESQGRSREDDKYKEKGISLRMDYRFDDRSSLTLQGMHKNKTRHLLYGLYNSIAFTYHFKEGTSTPGWFRYHNSYSSPSRFGNVKIQGIEYQNGWKLNKSNKLIIGAEWQRHNVYSSFYNYRGGINLGAIYLQDTISIGNKWQVIPGVRLDYQETTGSQWSPKIAANYRPDDKTKLYSSWGRTHNSPGSMHMFASLTNRLTPNKNLAPESGQTFTIGFERAFNEKSNLSMNYFYGYLDNVIYNETGGFDDKYISRFNNAWQEKYHGFEIAFAQKLSDKWNYGVGYTHSDAGYLYPKLGFESSSLYRIPKDSIVVGIHYQSGPWKANLISRSYFYTGYSYSKTYPQGNGTKNEMCSWFDLSASYDLNDQFTIYTIIKNIGNRKFGTNNNYIYDNPGRYYMLGATYKF